MKHIIVIFIALMGCLCLNAEVRIHMEKEAGVYKVPCQVNGLKMKFIFDTGAANVSISSTYAEMMLENGYLVESDFKGTTQSIIADGSVVDNAVVNLRKVEIAGQTIENVTALVVPSQNAPLLLGQSVIQRLGKVSIDGDYLVIHNANIYSEDEIEAFYTKANEFFDNGVSSEAIKYYKIVYDYWGEDTDPWVLLSMGTCYFRLKDDNSAVDCLYKAIDLDDGDNDDGILSIIYSKLVSYYCVNGEYNNALECAKLMEVYAVDNSKKAEAYSLLCEIYNHLSKFSEALTYSNKSITSYQQLLKKKKLNYYESLSYISSMFEKGISLESLNRYEEAIDAYQTGKRILGQYKNEDFYQKKLDVFNLSLSVCYEKLANH